MWISRTRAWKAILAEWEAGEHLNCVPRGDSSIAWAGLESLISWAINRGEARQRELIGMTAEQELPTEELSDRLIGKR